MLTFARQIAFAAMVAALPHGAMAENVTVFAAASLKTALDRIAADWQAETGNTVALSYAGTSQLARQIEAGAPADIFISAAVDWMDRLQQAGLILPDSRRDLLGNSLVLVGYGADLPPVTISADLDLAGMLGDGKLAMALVDSVPAGVYGKQALMSLGLWSSVEPQVAQAENVRAALTLVATGEAPFGIVYGSDPIGVPGITVVGTFPETSHAPIIYPIALIAESQIAAAPAFLDYLSGAAAGAVFAAQGFTVLP